jgi:hypothetical protein
MKTYQLNILKLFIPFIVIGLYVYYVVYINKKEIIYGDLDEEIFSKVETSDCKPIFENKIQYSVSIDNVTYPKLIPLHLNTTINFDCLNRNNDSKMILFWHEWWGSRTYSSNNKENALKRLKCPVTNCELTSILFCLYCI